MSDPTYPKSPYKGLAAYSEEDALFFFGREEERQNIISNLTASRLTLLYGESGVGKSSVLRAGVVPDLRRLARKNTDQSGSPEFAVAVFNSWHDDPLARLTDCVRESVYQTLDDRPVDEAPPSGSLVDTFRAWTKLVGGTLLVILDQFEDYFLYHGYDSAGRFPVEFSRLVNCRDLAVNFLISVRDDTYSRLDFLEKDIPGLFDNFLRISRLDDEATRAAIVRPIEQYNRFYGAGRKRISIEQELVDEVLKGPSKPKSAHTEPGLADVSDTDRTIETPFLQLVMTCLWKEEMRLGSSTLRLETLKQLDGVDSIVETHLSQAMKKLSRSEQAMAASVFHYLVTPSGRKIAYAVSDLARQEHLNQKETSELLEKLARGDNRILRPFALPERQGEQFYEISLDVLARPILDWRTRAEEKARAARLRRRSLVTIAIVFLFVVGAIIYAAQRRSAEVKRLREEQQKRLAVAAGNENSKVLARLYGILLDRNDPKAAAAKLQAILPILNKMLEVDRQFGNSAGEGITLNNIAGYHRYIAESYASIEKSAQAQDYYTKARQFYDQALEILERELGSENVDVATSLTGLGMIDVEQGQYAEAEQLFERSLTILSKALGEDNEYVADAMMNLAECYNAEGKYDQAEPLFKRALEIRQKELSADDHDLGESSYSLGWLYFERGNYALAEPLLKQALAIWRVDKSDVRDVATALDALSSLYREEGNRAEAERYRSLAWEIHQGFTELDPLSVAYHLANTGLLRGDQDTEEARLAYNGAVSIWTKALGSNHPITAFGLSNFAFFHYKHGRLSEAERLFKEALAIQQALPDSPELARTSYGLARLYADQGKYTEAKPLFQQALAIQEKAIPEHPDFANTLDAYADLLAKTGRQAAAAEPRGRAERIRQIHREQSPADR